MKHVNLRCQYCGKPLVLANIPNRGYVMAHRAGERKLCEKLKEEGRDMVSNRARKAG
jgi:hypothetical protein